MGVRPSGLQPDGDEWGRRDADLLLFVCVCVWSDRRVRIRDLEVNKDACARSGAVWEITLFNPVKLDI